MAVEIITDNDFKEVVRSNSKVIVKYFAGWCGNCKLFAPKFRRLSEDDRFTEIKFIDVNAEENQEARQLAGVKNLPYFAIFREGQLVEGSATSKEEAVLELLSKLN